MVIGKQLCTDGSDFCSQQGGAKGAQAPLVPKSTLLPSNEAALRVSRCWPAGGSPTGIPLGCRLALPLNGPLIWVLLFTDHTTLANGFAHHDENADPEGHGGDGDEEGTESGIAAIDDDSPEKEAKGEKDGAEDYTLGSGW